MIEGIKAQVKGEELKKLIAQQMAKLKTKHERLDKKLAAMRAAAKEVDKEIEPDPDEADPYANVSNSGKFSQARDRLRNMFVMIEELGFVHDHIVAEETYLLTRNELQFVGVGDYHGY